MKTTHVLGLALLLALALTACSSSANPTTGAPTGAGTPTASASGASTTVATTAATTAPTTGARVSAPATSARPGRCVSSVLRASLGQSRAAAGTSYTALLLTNRSRVTCILDGYPGVSFVGGTDAHQIGASAQRDPRFGTAPPVTLASGATVQATVAVAAFENYDQQVCQPARATGYRIFPPGSTGSLLISAPQSVCSKPGLQGFWTSAVRTGTIPH
jgi:Protein of unknown function (DUF4232)